MVMLKTAINAIEEILQTPLNLDGVTVTFETVILYLGILGVICLLIGGLFK